MTDKAHTLNAKQQRFVDEYMIDSNATQAAIRAGYKKTTARSMGQRLLTKVDVQAELDKKRAKLAKKNEVTVEWVINNFREIAERCMQRTPVMKYNKLDGCMEQVTDAEGNGIWQFDQAGANRANELLGKYLGIFTDKVKLDSDLTVNIVDHYDGSNRPAPGTPSTTPVQADDND